MEPYGALMEPYGALWSLIGPYGALMEPYGALWSLIRPLMEPYRSILTKGSEVRPGGPADLKIALQGP